MSAPALMPAGRRLVIAMSLVGLLILVASIRGAAPMFRRWFSEAAATAKQAK
jgi:hypothetical protein